MPTPVVALLPEGLEAGPGPTAGTGAAHAPRDRRRRAFAWGDDNVRGKPVHPGPVSSLVDYDGCPSRGTRWVGAGRPGRDLRSGGMGRFAFPMKGEVESPSLEGPRSARSSFLEEVFPFLFVFVFILIEAGFLFLGLEMSPAR